MSSTWSPELASSSPPSPMTPDSHSDAAEAVGIHDGSFMDVPSAWYHSTGVKTDNSDVTWNAHAEKREENPMFGLDDLLEQHAFEECPSTSATTSSDSSQSPAQPQLRSTFLSANLAVPAGTKPIPPPASRIPPRDPTAAKQKVVYPPRESCINLPIVIPSIPENGTKSRVETQIRVTLDLADAIPPPGDPMRYNRVGSWKWVKLPPGTATKKRTRKQGKIDATPEDTLYLTTVVSCATPPHTQVRSCSSCQSREAKRVAKKIASRIRPNKSDSESIEDHPKSSSLLEDTTSIIQFNCADSLEFDSGSLVLPLRLTCYCRHHKEKVGFIVHFALMDHLGRIVGTGSTRPIMITDDHKTPKSVIPATSVVIPEATTPTNGMDVDFTAKQAGAPSKRNSKDTNSKKRPKPYDGARQNNRLAREESVSSTNSPTSIHSPLPSTRASTPSQVNPSLMSMVDPLVYSTDFPPIPDPSSPFAFPFFPPPSLAHPPTPLSSSLAPPMIHRLIPATGPTCGGTEVTVLGSNFNPSLQLKCVFGDSVAESTTRWSDNTLVCVLPPRATAGVVGVWFQAIKEDGSITAMGGLGIDGSSVPFTYSDESDRALMELALQVVGLKMTGKIEGAKDVAMRIMGSTGTGGSNTGGGISLGTNQLASSAQLAQFHLREIQPALLLRSEDKDQLETLLLNFLSILDVDLGEADVRVPVARAINHVNSSGQTLIHLATFLRLERVLRFLIARGADLDVRDRNGWTPLHFCALVGGEKGATLAKALLAAGADREIVDVSGKTAFEYASPANLLLFDEEDVPEAMPETGATSPSVEEDEEAAWGDGEDESDVDATTSRLRRRRKGQRRHGPIQPHQSSSEDEKKGSRSEKPLKREKDEKQNATFLADLLQRTLTQLQNHAPQALTQLPKPYLGEKLPWNGLPLPPLPAMPMVFPVIIPMPGWPSFFSGEKDGEGEENPTTAAVKATLRATWERWLVQTKQADDVTPPPEYTPRAESSPSDTKEQGSGSKIEEEKQTEDESTELHTSKEIAESSHHPPRREKGRKKHDRMLLLFWLPTLLASLLWAFHTGLQFLYNTAKQVVASRAGAALV